MNKARGVTFFNLKPALGVLGVCVPLFMGSITKDCIVYYTVYTPYARGAVGGYAPLLHVCGWLYSYNLSVFKIQCFIVPLK